MRRLAFAVIMFLIAIGIVACGRTEQNFETRLTEVRSINKIVEL